ncbi:MAG: hypothetical protein ACRD8Z_22110, partial [Nitrososphaeraceae archaeon]
GFNVSLHVDLASQNIQTIINDIDTVLPFTDTEIEWVLPVIDEVRPKLDINAIERYCREYPIFTTDISFRFKLVDNSPDQASKVERVYDTDKGWITKQIAKAITGPARKAPIKIEYRALHPIAQKWNNKASIHTYKPGEFTAFIEGVHDKSDTTIYERIQQLREGTNVRLTPDLDVSIADLLANPKKDRQMERLFRLLRSTLDPPAKLSLPYSDSEQRKTALIERVTCLYQGNLDAKAAVYKTVDGFYKDDMVTYPYVFEIIAIPFNDKSIDANEEWVKSSFKGCVNYSVSPRSNLFEANYTWEDPKKTTEFSSPSASTITGILGVYNFRFYRYSDARTKLPCIMFANLVTQRVDYHGADKSRIDTTPFTEAIIKACRKVADNIQSFKAAGYEFHTKSSRSFAPIRERTRTIDDILEEFLTGVE